MLPVLERERHAFKERVTGFTNWWVVTGGPSCGKSSLITELAQRGYKTMPEAARVYIDNEIDHGRSLQQIRINELDFQDTILYIKEGYEELASETDLVFWDRGLHGDTIAYWIEAMAQGFMGSEEEVVTVVRRRYAGVFLLDSLPFQKDYERVEDEKQSRRIHSLIARSYEDLHYDLIRVPVLPLEERAQFVVDRIREINPAVPNLQNPQLSFSL